MSDNRLGISVGVSGVSQSEAEFRRLEASAKNLRDALTNLGRSNLGGSSDLVKNLAAQLGTVEARLKTLQSQFIATYSASDNFNIRAIAAIRGQADAIKGVARELTALDNISRARGGGNIWNSTVQDAIASRINTATAASAAEHTRQQRDLENTFRYGATSSSSAIGSSVSQSNEAQLERLRQAQVRAAGASAVAWKTASAETINDMLGIGRSAGVTEEEVKAAFRRMGRSAAAAGEEAGQGFWSRFLRGGRTLISLLDEGMRGQRSAMAATVGAGLKSADIGGTGLAAGIGGIVAVVETGAIVHVAEQMANLNEQIQAGAQTTGMSIRQYAQLQGALVLTGDKAESADATLRHFASTVEKAMANPNSEAAKSLHAIGIAQDEILSKGQNTYEMLKRVSEQSNKFADSSTKAAAWSEMFGRGDEAIAHFLSRFGELTGKSNEWADAVDKNNSKFIEMGGKLHKLSLDWETLKEQSAAPLDFVVNITIHGLELLHELPEDFAKLGKAVYDLGAPLRRLLGTTSPFEGAPAIPDTTLDDLQVSAPAADKRPRVQPFSTPKGAGNAEAHKDLAAFMEEERNKLRDVNLTLKEQEEIFVAMRSAAQEAFSKGTLSAAGLRQELAKIDSLTLEIQKRNFDRLFAGVKSDISDANKELREFETNMETMVKRSGRNGQPRFTQSQAIGFDIQEQAKQQQAGEAQIQSLYAAPGADIAKINAEWKSFESAQNAAAASLQEKYAAVDDSIAKKLEKAFTGVFDKIGGALERTLTEAILRTGTRGQAGKQLLSSLVGGGVSLLGDVGSKLGAKALGGTEGQGLGEVLSAKLFNLIGLGDPQKTVQTSLLTDIAANTLSMVTLLGTLVGVDTSTAVKPSVLGTTYALGGIVPSAAGGMIVGGVSGGIPSILHAKEMVLPAGISQGLQAMIASGGAGGSGGASHFTYSPTMNGGQPFQSRGSAENFFRMHGSQMEQMFRSFARNRTRF